MDFLTASFDIGVNNFCFSIEKVDLEKLRKIKKIPQTKKFNKDGTFTDLYSPIIKEILECSSLIKFENININDTNLFITTTRIIEILERESLFEKCKFILIEEQMKENVIMLKLAHAVATYFLMKRFHNQEVLNWSASYKTSYMGAPKVLKNDKYYTMTKYNRKKWAVQKVTEILILKNDKLLSSFLSEKKKDDISDTILMNISMMIKVYDNKSKIDLSN